MRLQLMSHVCIIYDSHIYVALCTDTKQLKTPGESKRADINKPSGNILLERKTSHISPSDRNMILFNNKEIQTTFE